MERMARDWQGVAREMPKPRGSRVESLGVGGSIIELWQQNSKMFAVVYGLQVKAGLTEGEAATELGHCILHALRCDNRLD